MKQVNWSKLLKVLIAVLTALAGAVGVASCTKRETPSNSPKRELAVAVENVKSPDYADAFPFRKV